MEETQIKKARMLGGKLGKKVSCYQAIMYVAMVSPHQPTNLVHNL
jgi:hypothetical protein